MWLLPEFMALASLPGVQTVNFDQCTIGAETTKPTRVLYFKVPLDTLHKRCPHPKKWWEYKDFSGKPQRRWGAHPPLARRVREDGTPATAAAAVYPGELNRALAEALAQAVGAPAVHHDPPDQASRGTPVIPVPAKADGPGPRT